jgi:hypothetical protein
MANLGEYYKAWRATKAEDLNVNIKIDPNWIELGLAVAFVMWTYKELFL